MHNYTVPFYKLDKVHFHLSLFYANKTDKSSRQITLWALVLCYNFKYYTH